MFESRPQTFSVPETDLYMVVCGLYWSGFRSFGIWTIFLILVEVVKERFSHD